ncbi:type II secretion system protein J [Verrucomicrobiota bacterium]
MKKCGFTLVEAVVAATILLIAISMAMAGFFYVMRGTRMSTVQDELDIDVQTSMERVKIDLRLSALDKMAFHPAGAGPYTAMSFPLARDDDGDGVVDLDAQTNIIWDKTLIYHVWESEPFQLRVTTFDPRTNLTDIERQEQIGSVVTNGNGASAHNAANASTRVIFDNVFTWNIIPHSSTYDGYNDTPKREVNIILGSCVLTNGPHSFTFTAEGKNTNSSGYKIGLDSLFVSPSYGRREAEAHVPLDTGAGEEDVGETVEAQYMAGGSWSGNYQLYFPADGVGDYFTLVLRNDQWEERNFRGTGYSAENTTVEFDSTNFIVKLEGNGTNWMAENQTGSAGASYGGNLLSGCAVRSVLRGEDMVNGGWLRYNGEKCRINFKAGTAGQNFKINAAFIGECSSASVPASDVAVGTQRQITFGSGLPTKQINSGDDAWSDWLDYPIDKEKTYLVSCLMDIGVGNCNPFFWQEVWDTNAVGSYLLTNAPSVEDTSNTVWNARADLTNLPIVLGVQYLHTKYPTNATYTSSIFDTRLDSPDYMRIDWTENEPTDTALDIRVRTGNSNDLSDAVAWTNTTTRTESGTIDPGDNRYVQFQAQFYTDPAGTATPILKDVTIQWEGETQLVDVGGTFTQGPDYGVFKLEVDGEELRQGIMIELEIFKDAAGYQGDQRMTSAMTAEIRPRNTGK